MASCVTNCLRSGSGRAAATQTGGGLVPPMASLLAMALPDKDDFVPAAVLSGFGLSHGWAIQHLRTLNNSVFRISRGGDPVWALRRHRATWRDPQEIMAELDLLDYLAGHLPAQIRVPRTGSGPAGDRLVTVDGTHYSLLEWVPGTPWRHHSGLDGDGAWLLGYGLGAIHSTVDTWDAAWAPIEWNAHTLFSAHPGLMGADPTDLQTILAASELELFNAITSQAAEAFDRTQDWGLIHADFILGNCHWVTDAEQRRLGVLDFDDFGRGPRLFDLAAILGNLADYPDVWPALAAAFLAGYRTTHPLPADAEQDLPVMMAARHTSQCFWALGHQDLGQDWITTHLRARLDMARECLAVRF